MMMMLLMLLIERPEYVEDDVANRKVKVLKMLLLIERSKMLLIEAVKVVVDRSGQSVDVVKD